MKTILVDAVFTLVSETGVIYEDVHQLLEQYPNKKIIVTNAASDKYEEYGLNRVPYEVFTLSHDPEKTDPSFFSKFLEYFALQPNEVVYFEHNPDAVKSAQSVGIASYHFDDKVRDIESLKQFLNENL